MKSGDAKLRVRYIKELEKFLRRTSAAFGDEKSEIGKICEMVSEGGAKLDLLPKIDIFNPYFSNMSKIAEELRKKANDPDAQKEDIFLWLSRSLNALEKLRREKSYSRTKSRKLASGEWD
ncbi:hypothetical protein FACS189487_07180 [Campylobacterota bacterium]|nr:hypothetical protein FACS189487_07180 [Campylobacterota bacterium]